MSLLRHKDMDFNNEKLLVLNQINRGDGKEKELPILILRKLF
jgi:hypothetical protein